MSEKLIVKNFGPIKEAEINLKKVTIFIGEQAGGKSTLAKLVAIMNDSGMLQKSQLIHNILFNDYEVNNFIKENTFIEFKNKNLSNTLNVNQLKQITSKLDLKNEYYKSTRKKYYKLKEELDNITTNKTIAFKNEDFDLIKKLEAKQRELRKNEFPLLTDLMSALSVPLYFPAERYFFSSIYQSIFKLNQQKITLPFNLLSFGSFFEDAVKLFPNYRFPKFDIFYKLQNENPKIAYNSKQFISLVESSSGLKSLFPLLLVTEYFHHTTNTKKNSFIIEEPELNLYPTTQKKLVEYLISKCTKEKNNLIITTHSPYILSTFDNCIQASNTVNARPELKAAVEKLIPTDYHLDYDDVAVYYVANGTVKSIMDDEYKGIDTNAIDDVSEDLGAIFDQLLALQYQD